MIGKVSTFSGPSGLFQGTSGTPSLVLSLDSNNILSYPGTGATWSDLSIRKNNGILNDVSSVTGSIPNTSLSFDGSTSYISFTQSDGIPSGNSQYTIEAWFNSNSYGVLEQGSIIGWGTVSNDNMSNVLRLSANGLTNYWWNNDITFSLSGTSSMIVGNWYYGVATFDGTSRKLYLNGELKETDTPGTHNVSDTSTLKIGNFYNTYFNGEISKVKISDKAISSSKVLSNFNSDKIQHGYVFGSMTFNDTDSYLISTSNDYVLGTNDFTVEAFFKTSTASNPYTGIVSQRQIGNYNISINLQNANTSEPLIEFTSGSNWSTYTASNNEWYHVAISRTGGTSSFFVNGNLFNEIADTTNYDISDLVVGRYYTSVSDYYFNGIISNVRVINGTGLYTGTFSIPDVQLGVTGPNTKLLITSQQTTPGADVSGLLQSVTASNIGWTSSLPSFVPNVVIDSLQFYVDAGQVSSYPGTGTTWYDISGNSRNLTMDSLSYSSNNGGYIIFDGSHTADSVATYSINFSNGFTVESVAKFSGSGYEGLFAFNNQMTSDYINVQAQGGTNIRWEVESGQSLTSTGTLSTNTWYHFTCVYEGDSNNTSGTARIYINGVENNTSSLNSNRTGQNQTSNFVLGLWDNYLTGNIALSRMYNKVLTPTEVLNNFNATKNRFGL
jgi:hypothetical protein